MNVLYLSYDGMTDPLGQSQVLPYFAGIAKAGHAVTIISFEKRARYKKTKNEIENYCKTNSIDWQPLSYTKRPPVFSTVWDVIRMRQKAFELNRKKIFNVVHCRSYIAALVGIELKRKQGLKFIFDMRGFWADERVEGGLWNLTKPLYKRVYNYFKQKEKEFLNEADYIISLTQNAADEIHGWKELSHQPVSIEVIPCCADIKLFDPTIVSEKDQQELKTKLGIASGDFVLSYIGSLGTWYMLDEMLDFFVVLLQHKPESKLLVITNDPETDLQTKASRRNIPLEKIIVTNSSRTQMPLHISLSNATLFFIRPSFSKKASSPVKQGEAMAMGVPIICNAGVGDTDRIVGEKFGIVISDFTTSDYEKAVTKFIATAFSSNEIRNEALRVLSLNTGIERYLRVYDKIKN